MYMHNRIHIFIKIIPNLHLGFKGKFILKYKFSQSQIYIWDWYGNDLVPALDILIGCAKGIGI